jgi:hypothetical protein
MTTMATVGTLKGGVNRHEAAVLRALARAYAEGTHGKLGRAVSCAGVTGCRCQGNDGKTYIVGFGPSLATCSCDAGRNGMTCKHLVSAADKLGMLDRLVPDFYNRFVFPGTSRAA